MGLDRLFSISGYSKTKKHVLYVLLSVFGHMTADCRVGFFILIQFTSFSEETLKLFCQISRKLAPSLCPNSNDHHRKSSNKLRPTRPIGTPTLVRPSFQNFSQQRTTKIKCFAFKGGGRPRVE
ncbi:unnamed protein product [Durusdinium trenchii]|uniref:Uncharacterized protein n=1 Tax=Durusdinium trenchii TaxID=1381693 RepID=A0ABP0PA62_9DINO